MEFIIGVISALFAVLLGLIGLEKRKTKKENAAREKAETEVQRLTVVTNVQKQADQVKDELAGKKQDLAQKKAEVEEEIEEIPQEEMHELSPEIKKLATAQYHRTHSRYERVLDDTD